MKSEEKLYKNKEWLIDQIEVLGKSGRQIAKECGVSPSTIQYWYNEENKNKKLEYQKIYGKENKEEIEKYRKGYIIKNKEKLKKYYKKYRIKNKDEKAKKDREYYLKNKENICEHQKEYRQNNKEEIKNKSKIYYNDHKEEIKEQKKLYRGENKVKITKSKRKYNKQLKIQAFNLLGGCKCAICGDTNLSHLTIDHIDNTGNLDKKEHKWYGTNLYLVIVKNQYPKEKLSNLRVLCWNHNAGRRKKYLDLSSEKQTNNQKYKTKLWKEAYDFFGPCKTCGDSDLTHLTISHIHNDGAIRRKNGEKLGTALLSEFKKLGWSESLKEDYCLECFNCNCSKE